jgi:poly-gamma-glutamate synthesis protein (capsule biosynthesis protein)
VRAELATATQSPEDLIVLLAGDLVLDAEDPEYWLSGIAPAVQAADIAIGHLEVPHTRRGTELKGDIPAPAAPPEHLDALAVAGFKAVSLAGNHIADWGREGIVDTLQRLDALGIAHTGAGSTLDEARLPARIECRGRQISLLSYNCVGPEAAWATRDRPGCNFLRIATADGGPVAPAAALTEVPNEALWQLTDDVVAARISADLVIVALHKGIVHTPAVIAPYEHALAVAALAAGADVVVGHHAHILRGVEVSDGRPVFHGLGNACVVTHALAPGQDHPARASWVRRRRELFGFEPNPCLPLAPFHPEAVHGVLGIVIHHQNGKLSTGVVPVHVEPPGRPVCVSDERADAVINYLQQIAAAAGLPAQTWRRKAPSLWLCE